MATIHKSKIGTIDNLAGGTTKYYQWNNYPEETPLGYTAIPKPPTASGEHGTSQGTVEITSIVVTYLRDNHNGDKRNVKIYVKNHGTTQTDVDIWQSWITS